MSLDLMAETIYVKGADGDEIEAYYARPLGAGPFPGVVVIHHMPGWDDATKEIARRFATAGYLTIAPHLYSREATGGVSAEDAAAAVRAQGGVPDVRFLGDAGGAAAFLRSQPNANGKVGVIGYCSGGRHSFLAACQLDFDAAVDCYGARVIADKADLTERQPVAPIDYVDKLSCPLLGLFGVEDKNPTPGEVEQIAEALRAHNKEFDFHTFDDAGHAFFAVDRPAYRVEAAVEGWKLIFTFFGTHLVKGN
jgi:carboxymethylenebutenolidase